MTLTRTALTGGGRLVLESFPVPVQVDLGLLCQVSVCPRRPPSPGPFRDFPPTRCLPVHLDPETREDVHRSLVLGPLPPTSSTPPASPVCPRARSVIRWTERVPGDLTLRNTRSTLVTLTHTRPLVDGVPHSCVLVHIQRCRHSHSSTLEPVTWTPIWGDPIGMTPDVSPGVGSPPVSRCRCLGPLGTVRRYRQVRTLPWTGCRVGEEGGWYRGGRTRVQRTQRPDP